MNYMKRIPGMRKYCVFNKGQVAGYVGSWGMQIGGGRNLGHFKELWSPELLFVYQLS